MSEPPADAYTVVELPAQPFVGITKGVTTTMTEIADEIPRLVGWLGERGYAADGPPFLRYLVIDMGGTMVVQAGVPVTEPVEGDAPVQAGELPVDKQRSPDGEVWANRVEWYETNPMEQADMDKWVTRLTFKLAD